MTRSPALIRDAALCAIRAALGVELGEVPPPGAEPLLGAPRQLPAAWSVEVVAPRPAKPVLLPLAAE